MLALKQELKQFLLLSYFFLELYWYDFQSCPFKIVTKRLISEIKAMYPIETFHEN